MPGSARSCSMGIKYGDFRGTSLPTLGASMAFFKTRSDTMMYTSNNCIVANDFTPLPVHKEFILT